MGSDFGWSPEKGRLFVQINRLPLRVDSLYYFFFFLSFPTIHLVGEQPKILVLDKGLVFLHFVL